MTDAELPGRLGDPDRSLETDPRIDPRLLATLTEFGLQTNGEAPPLSPDAPIAEVLAFNDAAEEGFASMIGKNDFTTRSVAVSAIRPRIPEAANMK